MGITMKKLPKFKRLNVHSHVRVKDNWRKPRGIDSKQRQKLKAYGAQPDVGYRTPRAERHLHPSGLHEVLVAHEKDLQGIDAKKFAVRFSSTLGRKKRITLEKKVKEKAFKILN